MPKEVEFETVCPDCGFVQKYFSYKKSSELEGERRATCKKCGRSYKALEQRKEKVADHRRKDNEDRPFDWHKFSKAGDNT